MTRIEDIFIVIYDQCNFMGTYDNDEGVKNFFYQLKHTSTWWKLLLVFGLPALLISLSLFQVINIPIQMMLMFTIIIMIIGEFLFKSISMRLILGAFAICMFLWQGMIMNFIPQNIGCLVSLILMAICIFLVRGFILRGCFVFFSCFYLLLFISTFGYEAALMASSLFFGLFIIGIGLGLGLLGLFIRSFVFGRGFGKGYKYS